jgi:hypothetical protein
MFEKFDWSAAGLGAVLAFFVIGIIGKLIHSFLKKWLDTKFDKRLLDVKSQLDTILNDRIKLSDKEYETLPEAWLRIFNAFGKTLSSTSGFSAFPDVNAMSDAELFELAKKSDMKDWELQEPCRPECGWNSVWRILR